MKPSVRQWQVIVLLFDDALNRSKKVCGRNSWTFFSPSRNRDRFRRELDEIEAKTNRPRSATIVLTRIDGGVIGTDFTLY